MAFLGSLEASLLDLSGQTPTWGPFLLLHRTLLLLTHGPLQSTPQRFYQSLLCAAPSPSLGAGQDAKWLQPISHPCEANQPLIARKSSYSPSAPQIPRSVSNIPTLVLHFYNFLRHESCTPRSALDPPSGTQSKLSKWFPWNYPPPLDRWWGFTSWQSFFQENSLTHSLSSPLSNFYYLQTGEQSKRTWINLRAIVFVNGPYGNLVLEYNISWFGVCIETSILVFCYIARFSCEVCNMIIITIQGYTSERNKAETWKTQLFQLQTALSTLPWDREHLLKEKEEADTENVIIY